MSEFSYGHVLSFFLNMFLGLKKYSSRVYAFGRTLGMESGESILRVFPGLKLFAGIVL